ncbi:hypothetical protein H6784_02200 [Candidatus Nomurabacteria bacterium]|nr:hypothetical protein [Candidatus Kaiserbacteria bacterium]MCB9814208.1 hypothetical protein [Candidatus Nomurabacteria bacterium]
MTPNRMAHTVLSWMIALLAVGAIVSVFALKNYEYSTVCLSLVVIGMIFIHHLLESPEKVEAEERAKEVETSDKE